MKIGNEGATLEFELMEPQDGDVLFRASFRDTQFAGETIASNFRVRTPDAMFAEMAENWRGWDGAIEWLDYEDRLGLSATSDGKGHVVLTVTMLRYQPEARLVGTVMLDAGELEAIALEMKLLFA